MKKHRRLYYDEEREAWVKVSENLQEQASSSASSPIDLSPPGSVASSESLSQPSSEDQLYFDENPCDIG